jgi:hypothetical protein
VGYIIGIGELVSAEGEYSVQETERDDAPVFPGGHEQNRSNLRAVSTSWLTFCQSTGLTDLFFEQTTLAGWRMRAGVHPLRQDMLGVIQAAREQWQSRYPGTTAGWVGGTEKEREINFALARLLWLEWWMQWALRECSQPTLALG